MTSVVERGRVPESYMSLLEENIVVFPNFLFVVVTSILLNLASRLLQNEVWHVANRSSRALATARIL